METRIIDLNGVWAVRGAGFAPANLTASVPGCIHEDLLRQGLVDDPFYRDNEKKLQWIGREDWLFSRRFEVDASILHETCVELVCEGIDTIATVSVNEVVVGTTENMHRCYRFDIKSHLRQGENAIAVEIASPIAYVAKRQAVRQMPEWADPDKQNGHGQIRKMASNFGWDWGPKLATSGIWRPIRIEAFSGGRIEHVRIDQLHRADAVVLQIHTELTADVAGGTLQITVVDSQGTPVGSTTCPPQATGELTIASPALWWPRDMGKQPLYTVAVALCDGQGAVRSRVARRVGLRQITLVREDDEWGESFYFKVNGKPVFCKGSNMIPTSVYGTCRDPGRYRVILERAANENLNTVRIWGGGIYEEACFYELCDELGFLVWQDFMFACSGYPLDEADFLANVCEEARQQLRRLGHHACLALWNGNNELELGWSAGWGLVGDTFIPGSFGKMEVGTYTQFFDQTLRQICACQAPQAAYWPASPHSPVGDRRNSNNERCGDAHIWNVLMAGEPFEFYQKCKNRFVSEYGYQSLPELATWKGCLAAEDLNLTSPMMGFRQRCHQMGNPVLALHLARYFRMPKDFEMTCILSQIQHGLLIKTAVEEWRRNLPRTMGAINWMLNDTWPGVTNSTIDYLDNPKASHYLHRQSMNPVLVSGKTDAKLGSAEIHVTCDYHPHAYGAFRWNLVHVDGRTLNSGEEKVELPQFMTRRLMCLDFKEQLEAVDPGNALLFLEITDGQCNLISDTVLAWCPWKHLNLQAAAITARQNGKQVELTTDKPALWAWVPQPHNGGLLQDNFVHLRPGRARQLALSQPGEIRELTPKSLKDTY